MSVWSCYRCSVLSSAIRETVITQHPDVLAIQELRFVHGRTARKVNQFMEFISNLKVSENIRATFCSAKNFGKYQSAQTCIFRSFIFNRFLPMTPVIPKLHDGTSEKPYSMGTWLYYGIKEKFRCCRF